MKLVVGLGNPGAEYVGSRHNLGFEVVEKLAAKKLSGVDFARQFWKVDGKFQAEIGKLGKNLLIIRPQTSMNRSGLAVAKLASFYKIKPDEIIIIHDELDLPLGHIKIRFGGAAAGHHGVESIIDSLGTDKFLRVRLGIGNLRSKSGEHKNTSFNAEHFVIESFLPSEKHNVRQMIKKGIAAVEMIVDKGLMAAQNKYNA